MPLFCVSSIFFAAGELQLLRCSVLGAVYSRMTSAAGAHPAPLLPNLFTNTKAIMPAGKSDVRNSGTISWQSDLLSLYGLPVIYIIYSIYCILYLLHSKYELHLFFFNSILIVFIFSIQIMYGLHLHCVTVDIHYIDKYNELIMHMDMFEMRLALL